jgi:tRNA-splicing ligase RtcB
MGSTSFHVRGRGCAQSLFSSSHGAGRRLSRTNARRQLSVKDVKRILPSPYLEDGQLQRLVDEATPAYKDVHRVIKSQTELVAVVRRLDPIFTYKGL